MLADDYKFSRGRVVLSAWVATCVAVAGATLCALSLLDRMGIVWGCVRRRGSAGIVIVWASIIYQDVCAL